MVSIMYELVSNYSLVITITKSKSHKVIYGHLDLKVPQCNLVYQYYLSVLNCVLIIKIYKAVESFKGFSGNYFG